MGKSAETLPDAVWQYRSDKPRLTDYQTDIDDEDLLPSLESSLEDIGEYQRRLWANQQKSLLLVFHGLDASGKDSLIRTLATYMDPAGFHAWSFGRPKGAEAKHDFLWRVMPLLPGFGEVTAFNRSHHEAVIAERAWPVHDPEHYHWPERYASLRNFEKHLASEGTVTLKFWLNLSEDEHKRRLLKRLDKPRKQWKFDPSDIDAWKRREELLQYASEAIAATHIPEAPWLIIPGDRKPVARAIVARTVADQLMALAPEYPPADDKTLKAYRGMLKG
ncbi:MAG: polyphosphate kinase [Halomonadaceae bacterium]|nr:MAG: polyphosphate kinase [Halomonadaceae bacterium]